MKTSADAASAKCCSGILRRLLCSGSLPTHPSDQFSEPNIFRETSRQKPQEFAKPVSNVKHSAPSSPGVVAKLMGLDSFPDTSMVPKSTTLGALLRSRSVNSIDFLLHSDPIKIGLQQKQKQQHRRVRTSISFREGVNDDCIRSAVQELEKVNKTVGHEEGMFNWEKPKAKYQKGEKESKPRSKNGEIYLEKRVAKKPSRRVEVEERKRSDFVGQVASKKKDFQRTRPVIKPVKPNEELKDSKCVKERKNRAVAHKVQSGSNLKKIHPEGSVPEVARGVLSRKHSKHSLSQDAVSQESCSCSSASAHDSGKGGFTAVIGRKNENKAKTKEGFFNSEMVEEVCRVAAEDVQENWDPGMVLSLEDFEEICQQFEQEILQVLLKQLASELVLLVSTRKIKLNCV